MLFSLLVEFTNRLLLRRRPIQLPKLVKISVVALTLHIIDLEDTYTIVLHFDGI